MFKRLWDRRRETMPVYMDPIEFSQVVAVVETLSPRRVLEWGSGGSTRALLENFPFIESLLSIEYDEAWYETVREAVTDPRLVLHHIAADKPLPPDYSRREEKRWEHEAELDPSLFHQYVDFPRRLGQRFDLVLVDGRARNFCLDVGYELLEPGGVMLLHDAERAVYRETLARFPRAVFLEPWKQGQICLVRRETTVAR